MTDYAALKAEDAKPAYIGMPDATRATTINGLMVPGLKSVRPVDAKMTVMRLGDWGWLAGVVRGYVTGTNAANASGAGGITVATTAPWQTRRTAETLMDLFNSSQDIDLSVQANVDAITAAMDILVTANVIKSSTRAALVALAATSTPWPVFHGWQLNGITPGELVAARAWV